MEPTDADTPHRRVSAAYAGRLASYGLRAHPATIVTFAMYRLDALVIGALMMATGPVGLYSVAYQWAHRLGFLSQALGTVLMPRIAQLADAEEVRRALTPIVTRTAVWLSIPGALVMAVAAPVVIPGLYGERFADSVLPLQVMLPGVALWNVSRTLSSDLAGRGRPGASSAVDVGGLLLNVALDVAWIPEHGIVGAAAATTASLAIATVAKVALYATVAGVPWRQLFVPEAADGERLRTAVERLLRPLRRGRSAR